MRLLIRWVGYGFIVVGVTLFIASYLVTYNGGGISAIAERFYHPLADAFQLAMCIGPGLLLIGIADWLEKRGKRSDRSRQSPSKEEQEAPSVTFMSALPNPKTSTPLKMVELRGLLFMYYENAQTIGEVSANVPAFYKFPQSVVVTRERQLLLIIRIEESPVGSMLCAIVPSGEIYNFGSFSLTEPNTFLTKAAQIVSEVI